jgi:hypothetical protein
MDVKNNTEFDINWLRSKGFIGNWDTGDEVDPADPEKSEVFTYRELMDYEGYKEIKVFIAIDIVIPGTSRIYFQYRNSHNSLKHREYNGDIMSKEMLILLLKAIYPELAKKFAK